MQQVRRASIEEVVLNQPEIRGAEAATDYYGDEQPTQGRQRRGGRFASTGTSKRPKASEDHSWIVSRQVDGGSIDGSVIPSFLRHVASRMLGGELRSFLTCYNRSLACQNLGVWLSGATPEILRIPIEGLMVSESCSTERLHAMSKMMFGVDQEELLSPL
ncbi:uncharacterized protein [Euphorbia lathyris]|uniref:uncharacterized protein n=1 Tax=Euphorbia lathyris TaxID=212925 RepID=UPI003313FA03